MKKPPMILSIMPDTKEASELMKKIMRMARLKGKKTVIDPIKEFHRLNIFPGQTDRTCFHCQDRQMFLGPIVGESGKTILMWQCLCGIAVDRIFLENWQKSMKRCQRKRQKECLCSLFVGKPPITLDDARALIEWQHR